MLRILTVMVALVLILIHGSEATAANGSISGRVSATDKKITNFLGVQVYIPGTSYISRTDQGGYFHIGNVPAGTYDVKISPPNETQIGTMGETKVFGVTVRPNTQTTIYPTMVPVIPKLIKVDPIIIDRDVSLRIQGENFSKESMIYPCTVYIWGQMTNNRYYTWPDAHNLVIPETEVAIVRKELARRNVTGKVEVIAYCMGAYSNPLQVEFRKTAAAPPPTPEAFVPSTAIPGQAVTLTGSAKPGTFMSAYFYCTVGCGETHLGVAKVDAGGKYGLSFKVPVGARSGAAYVQIGCDNCGNGWRKVSGLMINQGAAPHAPQRLRR